MTASIKGVFSSLFERNKQIMKLVGCFVILVSFVVLIGCEPKSKGEKAPEGALKASPSSVQFGGDLAVNTESATKSFTVTNTAAVDVTGMDWSLQKGQDKIFLVGSDCTNLLVSGAKCNVQVAIKPDRKSASFTDAFVMVYETDKGQSKLSVSLSGNTLSSKGEEILNNIFLSGTDGNEDQPKTKTMPNTKFGSVSDVATLGLTYQGATPIIVQITPPTTSIFRVVTDCTELKGGEKCNIFATFAPIAIGLEDTTFKITLFEEGASSQSVDVTLVGTGEAPEQVQTVVMFEDNTSEYAENKKLTFALTTVGDIDVVNDTKTVVLKNKSETTYLYRLASTLKSVSFDYGSCTGKLTANSECKFTANYSPNDVVTENGFISFISGRSITFIAVTGSGKEAFTDTKAGIKPDKEIVKFPSTEIGFSSEAKKVKIKNDDTAPSGNIKIALKEALSPFFYSTSCIDNAPLLAGTSCEIDLTFRPDNETPMNHTLLINIAAADNKSKETIEVKLGGTGRVVSAFDNSTNIEGLTISSKRYSFPDTGVGLKSSSVLFTLTNTSEEDITGFTSTSTDLIRYPLDKDSTTCTDTIRKGASCVIAYYFHARDAVQTQAFLKLRSSKSEGESVNDSPELVELSGRGVLFNKYIYFGYVDGTTTDFKDITYAVVNDTQNARHFTKAEVETVRWVWKARDNNYFDNTTANEDNATRRNATMVQWFPSKTEVITNKFTRLSSANSEVPEFFSIVSDSCSSATERLIAPGSSCMMKIRYNAKLQTDNDSKKPVSAYIKLYSGTGGSEVLVDQFHAVASGQDDVTYFFPPEDKIGTTTYERPIALWDIQSVIIDENLYTYSGANTNLTGGYTADSKVRRYDAARNIWKSLTTTGTDYIAAKYSTGASAGQVRMISFNKKLYFYGGNIFGPAGGFLGQNDALVVLDLDKKTGGSDAEWKTLSINSAPGMRGQVNMAGFSNKIYLWGGLEERPRNVLFFDLLEDKWYRAGQEKNPSASIANVDAGCTYPQNSDTLPTRRGYAATLFYGNKLFVHAGLHSLLYDPAACGTKVVGNQSGFLNNDLWTYEVESYDGEKSLHSADVNKWKLLTSDEEANGLYVGTDPKQDPDDLDVKRPYAREKHEWDTVGNKLLLKASGFSLLNGNGLVSVGVSNYYFYFDPINGGSTERGNYNGWSRAPIITRDLAQHKMHMIEGVIWFFNKNVMGVQISSTVEADAKK